jgi:hypothetical protein
MKMKNLVFVLFLINLLKCNCETEGDEQEEADLTVDYFENGFPYVLQAYKNKRNERIFKENNSLNYHHLEWFSIGHPILVKTNTSNNIQNLFHFNPRGFSANIQMLTSEHKKTLVEEVNRKYNISIHSNQIISLQYSKFSKFSCKILMHNSDNPNELTYIDGDAIPSSSQTLRIDFKAPKGSKDITWFNQSLQENESIQMDCEINAKKFNFSSKFRLYTENTVTVCGLKVSDVFHVLKDESSIYINKKFFISFSKHSCSRF